MARALAGVIQRKANTGFDTGGTDQYDTAGRVYLYNFLTSGDWYDGLPENLATPFRSAAQFATQNHDLEPKKLREGIRQRLGSAEQWADTDHDADVIASDVADKTPAIYRFGKLAAQGYREWVWHTVNDDRVDKDCEALDGKVFPMDQPFAPAHVNCRCIGQPWGRRYDPNAELLEEMGLEPEPIKPRDWAKVSEDDMYEAVKETLASFGDKAVGIENLSMAARQEVVITIDKLRGQYPKVWNWMDEIRVSTTGKDGLTDNVYANAGQAGVHSSGGELLSKTRIVLNDVWFSSRDHITANLENDVKLKFHPKGTASIDGIIRHEFGHITDFYVRQRYKDIAKSDLKDELEAVTQFENLMFVAGSDVPALAKWARYAAENEREAFAEAVSWLTVTKRTTSQIAKQPLYVQNVAAAFKLYGWFL